MKKTFTILLLSSCVAMGADPLDITWTDNTASIETGLNTFSAVFTLDLTALYTEEWQGVFTYTSNKSTYQYGLFNQYTYWGPGDIDSKIMDVSYLKTNNGKLVNCNAGYRYKNAVSAVIAYVFAGESESINLTLYNAEGGVEHEESNTLSLEAGLSGITNFYKHSAVGAIDIYGTALKGDEINSAVEHLLNPNQPSSPSVPEPTTATLSLLALAGLAARRRRH